MAVTSIWPIKGRIDKVINYARNPEKTTEGGLEKQAALHAVDDVIEYAADDIGKEEPVISKDMRESGIWSEYTWDTWDT